MRVLIGRLMLWFIRGVPVAGCSPEESIRQTTDYLVRRLRELSKFHRDA